MLRHSGCKMCTRRYMGDGIIDVQTGIFAVSTFNTDYILVKDADFEKSLAVLLNAGYTVI